MKLASAFFLAVAAFASCAATETDTITVSAVVSEACIVVTEPSPRVVCNTAASAATDGEGEDESAAALTQPDVQTTETDDGAIVLVSY